LVRRTLKLNSYPLKKYFNETKMNREGTFRRLTIYIKRGILSYHISKMTLMEGAESGL